jgi:hypothetical protein
MFGNWPSLMCHHASESTHANGKIGSVPNRDSFQITSISEDFSI